MSHCISITVMVQQVMQNEPIPVTINLYLVLLNHHVCKQPSGATRQVSQNHALTRPSNREGFYLGIRDEGTCGDVIRIIVYYVVCPRRVEGLVTYPETALPVQRLIRHSI